MRCSLNSIEWPGVESRSRDGRRRRRATALGSRPRRATRVRVARGGSRGDASRAAHVPARVLFVSRCRVAPPGGLPHASAWPRVLAFRPPPPRSPLPARPLDRRPPAPSARRRVRRVPFGQAPPARPRGPAHLRECDPRPSREIWLVRSAPMPPKLYKLSTTYVIIRRQRNRRAGVQSCLSGRRSESVTSPTRERENWGAFEAWAATACSSCSTARVGASALPGQPGGNSSQVRAFPGGGSSQVRHVWHLRSAPPGLVPLRTEASSAAPLLDLR